MLEIYGFLVSACSYDGHDQYILEKLRLEYLEVKKNLVGASSICHAHCASSQDMSS